MPSGLVIGVPSPGHIDARVTAALFCLERPASLHLFFMSMTGNDPAAQRNEIIRRGLASDVNWFLFLDADVMVPPDLLPRLLSHCEVAVSGMVATRHAGHHAPAVVTIGNGPDMSDNLGRVFEVQGIGAACLLVEAAAVAKVDDPWFEWTKEESEDMAFARKLRAAGVGIKADGAVQCGHILKPLAPPTFTPQFERWKKQNGVVAQEGNCMSGVVRADVLAAWAEQQTEGRGET